MDTIACGHMKMEVKPKTCSSRKRQKVRHTVSFIMWLPRKVAYIRLKVSDRVYEGPDHISANLRYVFIFKKSQAYF